MAKKSKKGIKLNFDGVETGYKAVPEGTYEVRVKEVEAGTSQANAPKLDFKFEIISGKNKGSLLFYTCSLQPQALFKLKVVLEALGYEIPEGNFNLDIDELIDLECSVEVAHETYEGKKRARIVEFITSDEDDEDDSEDEDDDSEDEEDTDDEDEEEDEEEDDEDDDEDEDEDEDDDGAFETSYEVTCPNCGTVNIVDEDTLMDSDKIVCAECGAAFDVEVLPDDAEMPADAEAESTDVTIE